MSNLSQICPNELSFLFSSACGHHRRKSRYSCSGWKFCYTQMLNKWGFTKAKVCEMASTYFIFYEGFFGSSWVTHFWKILKMNIFINVKKKSLNNTNSGFWLLIPNRVRKKRLNILKCRKDNLFAWPASDLLHKPMRE